MEVTKMRVKVPTKLHVRSGPGLEYRILDALDNKTVIEVTEQSNGWYRIQAFYLEKDNYRVTLRRDAWVCGKYLRKHRERKLFG